MTTNNPQKTVFLGMSGGVDSSVSAVLLKNAGYKVVGVYMKNWSKNLPGMKCPWAEDLADAKRVATKLDIDFLVFDFEKAYKTKVVDYMLDEFKAGRTPNPDIMCNEEIKFKLFFEESLKRGADFIATGHYAKSEDRLLKLAKDENKDQTYFLYRISKESVEKTLFPLADLRKPEVKKLAKEFGLPNAFKKESMGICFVGDVNIKDFLREYIELKPGEIRDMETDKVLGFHDGAVFYTLGQRHGLNVGGGLPYYVVKKDLERNIVFVSKNLNEKDLWAKEIELENIFFRDATEQTEQNIRIRIRHRAPLIPAKFVFTDIKKLLGKVVLEEQIKKPAAGQSIVFYDDEICLGGGIVK
ncbi:tRNA 2-thiouridine(34) synthase MnmA [Candidatus Saccharibacteria bacterium]|nr:tRNA 2-thiouridine(34) synthase MnmA [Candidatus Saccharibacteria bacterium]